VTSLCQSPAQIGLEDVRNDSAEPNGCDVSERLRPAPGVTQRRRTRRAEIPPSSFALTSVTYDQGTHSAIINGKIMQKREQFGLQMGNQTYQIALKAILDGRVVLQHRVEEIIVPLRRKISFAARFAYDR
jgi:hypothetical protein